MRLRPAVLRLLHSLAALAFCGILALTSAQALAAGGTPTAGGSTSSAATAAKVAPITALNPLGGASTDLNLAIGNIIKAALGLSGAVALLMFVWGGVQWLISGGSAERVKAGKNTLTWAALGLVVIFTAYTLVNVVVTMLSGATS